LVYHSGNDRDWVFRSGSSLSDIRLVAHTKSVAPIDLSVAFDRDLSCGFGSVLLVADAAGAQTKLLEYMDGAMSFRFR